METDDLLLRYQNCRTTLELKLTLTSNSLSGRKRNIFVRMLKSWHVVANCSTIPVKPSYNTKTTTTKMQTNIHTHISIDTLLTVTRLIYQHKQQLLLLPLHHICQNGQSNCCFFIWTWARRRLHSCECLRLQSNATNEKDVSRLVSEKTGHQLEHLL